MSQRKRTKDPLSVTTRQGMILLFVLTMFFVIVFYLVYRYLSFP